jgi:hypothetical protein
MIDIPEGAGFFETKKQRIHIEGDKGIILMHGASIP